MKGLMERNDLKKYENEKKRHRRRRIIILIGVIIGMIFLALYVLNLFRNKTYSEYKILKSIPRADSNTVNYIPYGSKILKYSRDGASGINSKGEVLWNGSYNFKNPSADICENYVAIADIGGKEAYVYNGSDSGVKIKTLKPIIQIQVANQGVMALVLEDKDSNEIQIYDPYNKSKPLIVEFDTNIKEDGYPVDIALSDDGTRLVTSYLYVNNAIIESSVNFYNFTDVGKNSGINRIVGARSFENTLIPKVDFITNNIVCVYGEKGFTLYSMRQKPEDIMETVTFENEVKSTFCNGSYIGFILETKNEEHKYQAILYNLSGRKKLEIPIDCDYDTVVFGNNELIFYSELECNIIRLNGKEKFKYAFNQEITCMIPEKSDNTYIMIDSVNINIIKLLEGKKT